MSEEIQAKVYVSRALIACVAPEDRVGFIMLEIEPHLEAVLKELPAGSDGEIEITIRRAETPDLV